LTEISIGAAKLVEGVLQFFPSGDGRDYKALIRNNHLG